MTEQDGIDKKGIDLIEQMMKSMKNDILEQMDERSKKQKDDIIGKIEENSKKQTETLAEITTKNNEQDKRLDKIEASNIELTKRIEELEKTRVKTWANVTATNYIPNSAAQDILTSSRNQGMNNDKSKESEKSDDNSIQYVLEQASKIVGL